MPVNVNGVTLGNTFSAGSYEVPSMVVFVHTRAVLSAERAPFCEDHQLVMDDTQPPLFIHTNQKTLMHVLTHTPTLLLQSWATSGIRTLWTEPGSSRTHRSLAPPDRAEINRSAQVGEGARARARAHLS